MFKRVLMCYDGSDEGRRALKRGAELAMLVGAKVHVLSIIPANINASLMLAQATGHGCSVDVEREYHQTLAESIEWLKIRGVDAAGSVVHGDTIEAIGSCAKKMNADLIVVGHYPKAAGGRWWSSSSSASLAERVECCVLIARGE